MDSRLIQDQTPSLVSRTLAPPPAIPTSELELGVNGAFREATGYGMDVPMYTQPLTGAVSSDETLLELAGTSVMDPDLPEPKIEVDALMAGLIGSRTAVTSYSARPSIQPIVGPAEIARGRLADLSAWIGLDPEALGDLVGAARRTVYYWLEGRPIGTRNHQERIERLHSTLEPLAASRDPILVRAWLKSDEPAPSRLIKEERWDELAAAVAEATAPVKPASEPVMHGGDEQESSAETLMAALSVFTTPRESVGSPPRRRRPREVTGLVPEPVEGEE